MPNPYNNMFCNDDSFISVLHEGYCPSGHLPAEQFNGEAFGGHGLYSNSLATMGCITFVTCFKQQYAYL